jgi:regulatory protein
VDDDPRPDPDRPPSRRPVRVARFDAGPEADRDPDGEAEERRVAGPDDAGPDAEGARRVPTKVAAFDALATTPAASAQVVDFADLVAQREGRRRSRPDAGRGGVEPERGSPAATGLRGGARSRTDGPPADVVHDAADGVGNAPDAVSKVPDAASDLPPDGPLPRGRRRGARVGRLGPDAPDPDRPGPGQAEALSDPVAIAREICLRLLTDRARTRQELAQALGRKGVPAEAAAAVLDRFDEVGLIDDAAFAGQWVRARHTHRGLGRRAIAVELRRKGVADDVAGEALAEVDAEAEARRARELVDRKLRSLAVGTAEQRAAAGRRLVGMLARKGYGAGTAYRVVREALAERGAEGDELGADGELDE